MAIANRTNETREPQQQFAGNAGHVQRKHPTEDAINYLKEYARENPEMSALWCFGIGFVLGWRLKPW